MKVQRLIIKNIGIIAEETIEVDKPLILFYGEIKQGKTTILNAIKWVCGGSYPSDLIRHGQKEASVKLMLDIGSITREWYVTKEGPINDRPIVFIRDGEVVKKPVDEIKKFLNPFLLDNEHLKRMGEKDRQAFFVDLFGVDTSDIDKDIATKAADAKTLRVKIGMYGDIDTTEVKQVDLEALREKRKAIVQSHTNGLQKVRDELAEIRTSYQQAITAVDAANDAIREHNRICSEREQSIRDHTARINDIDEEIKFLQAEKSDLSVRKIDANKWLADNPRGVEIQKPAPPDTSALESRLSIPADTAAIDEEISQAAAAAVKYEQYQKNLTRAKDKKADEVKLSELEASQRELKKQKTTKLKGITDTCGIPGLSFDDTGNFVYDSTMSGMLSTSQIMKLSSELSALYPAGFGLELIDRAESLGKSIFTFIERAQREEKSILATIVGEKPAEVPENIGVFVVEDGKVKG